LKLETVSSQDAGAAATTTSFPARHGNDLFVGASIVLCVVIAVAAIDASDAVGVIAITTVVVQITIVVASGISADLR